MIPRSHIIEWQKYSPWQTLAQVEQDLVIERAVIELFSDELIKENLAFRGGTELYKIFMKPQVRYSEDIDLVQIKPMPIKPVLQQIKKAMSFLGNTRNIKQNDSNNTIYYRFETEVAPVIKSRLKIEINCREHFAVLGWNKVSHTVNCSWFSGTTDIISYELEELLGTKLRALYQRRKGRDLFDIYYALLNYHPDCDKIIYSFKKYMTFSGGKASTARVLLKNIDEKVKNPEFNGDTNLLISPKISYDVKKAWELVKFKIIEKI